MYIWQPFLLWKIKQTDFAILRAYVLVAFMTNPQQQSIPVYQHNKNNTKICLALAFSFTLAVLQLSNAAAMAQTFKKFLSTPLPVITETTIHCDSAYFFPTYALLK